MLRWVWWVIVCVWCFCFVFAGWWWSCKDDFHCIHSSFSLKWIVMVSSTHFLWKKESSLWWWWLEERCMVDDDDSESDALDDFGFECDCFPSWTSHSFNHSSLKEDMSSFLKMKMKSFIEGNMCVCVCVSYCNWKRDDVAFAWCAFITYHLVPQSMFYRPPMLIDFLLHSFIPFLG